MRGIRSAFQSSHAGLALGVVGRLDLTGLIYLDSDKYQHGYMPYYRRHLRHLRLRRNLVWEIGVGGYDLVRSGGSLRIWRDSLPRSVIVGLDIHEKRVDLGPRVHVVQADQSNPEDLRRVLAEHGVPNIVIDDGSHMGAHVWASFETIFPMLASGSLYVIEDIHTSYWPDYGGDTDAPRETAVGLLRGLVEAVQDLDPTFERTPDQPRPHPSHLGVAEVAIYPGIAFVTKG